MKLLSSGKSNTKISKNKNEDYLIFSLNLKPAETIIDGKTYNVCPFKGTCAKLCVGDNGHFSMRNGSAHKAQIRKTKHYFTDTANFYTLLQFEIETAKKQAKRKNAIPVFRLNAYSDINHAKQSKRYLGESLYKAHPDAIFYDYTKDIAKAKKNAYENYDITISYDEKMSNDTLKELVTSGKKVAVVFEEIPERYLGLPCFNGDNDDNRFLDPKGHIIALKFKGSKMKLLEAIADGFCIPKKAKYHVH